MRALKIPMLDLAMLSRQVSEKGGRLRFECRLWGTSMSPTIRHGDTLSVESAGKDDVTIGDVVLYAGDHGKLVAHRLVRRDERDGRLVLVARSDVVGARDETVILDHLVGRLVAVKRGNALRRSASIISAALSAFVFLARSGSNRVRTA